MAATLFATNIGGTVIMGFAGWRVAFCVIALISVVTGVLVVTFARDPRAPAAGLAKTTPALSWAVLQGQIKEMVVLFASPDVQAVLRNKSFQIIILQGIVGTVCLVGEMHAHAFHAHAHTFSRTRAHMFSRTRTNILCT